MIRKTERYFKKRVTRYKSALKKFNEYGQQNIKRTTYWLFWIVPIFIKDEVQSGDYEDKR